MIYTSYFAKLKELPSNFYPVSIARWQPKWLKNEIPICIELSPPVQTLSRYKDGLINDEIYEKEYKEQVLLKKTPEEFVKLLEEKTKISNIVTNETEHVVLFCYEKNGDFCHRNLFAAYMRGYGIPIRELTKEDIERSVYMKDSHKENIIKIAIQEYKNSITFGYSSLTKRAIDFMEEAYYMCAPYNIKGIDELRKTIEEAKEKYADELEMDYEDR